MRAKAMVAVLLLIGGCKKTVEGENKNWTRNVQHVQELQAQYPGFAAALKDQLAKAQSAMDAAKSVGGDETRAKAMSEANNLIDSGFVYELGQLDAKTKRLREKSVTAATSATDPADQTAARTAGDDAQRVLRNVDDALRTGAPDAMAASGLLHRLDGDISTAIANLDHIIDSAKKRAQAAAKPAAGAGAVGGAGAAAAPVAQVQWKCKYCQHMNDDVRKKCENCGAPRPNK
jgi:hypothetical protein